MARRAGRRNSKKAEKTALEKVLGKDPLEKMLGDRPLTTLWNAMWGAKQPKAAKRPRARKRS